jgi:uncharacterized protein (TIRG00374 family)
MQDLPELNRRQLIIGGIVVAAAIVGLYFLIPKIAGLHRTWGQLKHGDPWLLVLGGLLELLSIAGYTLLFHTVLGRGMERITWRVTAEITLAGIAAIRLLAAAGVGGVAVSAWALTRAGMSPTLIACRMIALYVVQYSIYLAAMIVCGLGLWFGFLPGGGSFSLTVIPAILSATGIALVLSMALIPHDIERRLERLARRGDRIGSWATRLATAPAAVGSGVRTALSLVRARRAGLLGSVAYWGFDIAVLGLSFKAFNEDMSVAVLVMGYFLGTLGSLLPLPGGVGGIEAGMIGAFVAFGIPVGSALVGVLAYRAISFWIPTIPGIAGYVKLRSTVRGWRQADREIARA